MTKVSEMHSYRVVDFAAPLQRQTDAIPVPQGREVVLKIEACGLCHSDLHLHDGYFDMGNGVKADASKAVAPPRTLGHEIVGTVIAAGPQAQDAPLGARRLLYPWLGCGSCDICQSGNEQICPRPAQIGVQRDGGFSSYVLVPDAKYLVDFGDLPEEQACTYACSGLTAYAALKKLPPFARDGKWLLIGAGGVGLSGLRYATAMGLPAPIVAEIDRTRWDLVREAGAADVIDPSDPDALRQLRRATQGGVQAVVDFVGAGSSFTFGFNSLTLGGTFVSVGLFGGIAEFSPARLALRSISVLGSMVGTLEEMKEAVALARTGQLPALPVQSRPLCDVNAAMDDLRAGAVRGRIVLRP